MTTTDVQSDAATIVAQPATPPAGPPPAAVALQLAGGFIASQAVYAFAKLQIADALAGGPRPVEVVASRAGTQPELTARLLRTLAGLGVVENVGAETYQLTEVGALFRNEAGSLADLTLMWMETHYDSFAGMTDTLRTGRPAFESLQGEDYWSWLEHEPDKAELFSRAMGSFGSQTQTAALDAHDCSGYRRIVDVGGAHGSFLAGALSHAATARGVLFDLPHVVEHAGTMLDASGVGDRVDCVGGDFFDAVPGGGDAYLLSMILHDWDDEHAVRILESIRRAIPSHGVVLILENVIPDDGSPHLGKMIDLIMMTILTGTERTRSGYEALLARAGFAIDDVVVTAAPTSLIVARPV